MSERISRSGRSTKNISSILPLRNNSGGSCETSFAVATKNTFALCSAIQVKIVASNLRDTPPSVEPLPSDAIPFSISSIHNTQGAIASA